MNITDYIFEYLKSNEKVSVEGFGVFYLHRVEAKVDTEHKSILPPAKEIALDIDYQTADEGLLVFISEKNISNQAHIRQELQKLIQHWKNLLEDKKGFDIENFGTFRILEGKPQFIGHRINTDTPDFYGLEKIDVQKLKQGRQISSRPFSISRLILFLFLIIIMAFMVGAYLYPQYFFGEESVLKLPEMEFLNTTK